MTKIAIIEDDIGLNKGIELALKREDYVNMFYLVGGALAAVLALIGILNFINAIVTGMLARQQEFAMMEAVGMTERQLACGRAYAMPSSPWFLPLLQIASWEAF